MIAKIEQVEHWPQLLYLMSQGVQIFRIHNVKEIKQGILVYEKIILNK